MKNRGNYYKLKTKKWFVDRGYFSDYLEKNQRIYSAGKVFFIKKDIAGCDGFAMNAEEIIFWQSKFNRQHIDKGIKEFNKYPWPKDKVKCWVVVWTLRAREPEIIIVE